MAPEIGKRGVQARADMYSFGIILFEMCFPMKSRKKRKKILKHIREKDIPIEAYMTKTHEFFEVCMKNFRETKLKLIEKYIYSYHSI